MIDSSGEALLRPGRVAKILGITPWTLRSWDATRRLTVKRTLGGHRRYVESEVTALAAELTAPAKAVA